MMSHWMDVWTSSSHTDMLTDTWMPKRHQHEEEVLYEPSCNTI